MASLSRRTFLQYTAATAGALALPQIINPLAAEAAPSKCLWGAFADPHELFNDVDKFNGDLVAAYTYFEKKVIGRKVGMTRHYPRWDYSDAGIGGTPTFPSTPMRTLAAGGRTPLMDWRCQRMDDSYIKWSDIAGGVHDAYITSVANSIATWGNKVFIVINHEPENDAATMAPGLSLPLAGAQFKAAYKRIHDIFDNAGATNVRWVCTLVQGTYAGTKDDGGTAAWFPKSATYVGVDGYNRGSCSGGWKSFASLFGPAHSYAVSVGKHMIVEENGCVDDMSNCHEGTKTKNEWFIDAGHTIKSWPELKAVVYSHVDAAFRGIDTDFRVNTTASALNGYKAVGNDPYFGGRGASL